MNRLGNSFTIGLCFFFQWSLAILGLEPFRNWQLVFFVASNVFIVKTPYSPIPAIILVSKLLTKWVKATPQLYETIFPFQCLKESEKAHVKTFPICVLLLTIISLHNLYSRSFFVFCSCLFSLSPSFSSTLIKPSLHHQHWLETDVEEFHALWHCATIHDSQSQPGMKNNIHTHSQPSGIPSLLDEVIIARGVYASIAHSAQELTIHTYCSLYASVKVRTSIETQELNQSPMHIKKMGSNRAHSSMSQIGNLLLTLDKIPTGCKL